MSIHLEIHALNAGQNETFSLPLEGDLRSVPIGHPGPGPIPQHAASSGACARTAKPGAGTVASLVVDEMKAKKDCGRQILGSCYELAFGAVSPLAWNEDWFVNPYGQTRSALEILHETYLILLKHPERLVDLRDPLAFIANTAKWAANSMARGSYRHESLAPVVEPARKDELADSDGYGSIVDLRPAKNGSSYDDMCLRDMREGLVKHLKEYAARSPLHAKRVEVLRRIYIEGESIKALAIEFGVKRGAIHKWVTEVREFLRTVRHMLQ